MRLLRTVVSSLGTYISLIGQNSTSALLSPSTRPRRHCDSRTVRRVKGCNRPSSLMLTCPLSLGRTGLDFDNSYSCSFKACSCVCGAAAVTATGGSSSEKGINKLSTSTKQAGSPNYTKSLWCSYNLDIMCYTPEPDIPRSPAR